MGLYEDILSAAVTELDLRELIAVRPETTVREAIQLMRKKSLGCTVVVDDAGKPLGKFTERGLVALLLSRQDALDQPVSEHMDEETWCYVKNTDPIAAVLTCMQQHGARFVVVLDEAGRAVALTGQKSVMEYIAKHFPRQVKVQRMRSIVTMEEREGA